MWVYTSHSTQSEYLRPTVDTQGAHLVHAQVTHVHALGVDLNTAALEILLVINPHLNDCSGEQRK